MTNTDNAFVQGMLKQAERQDKQIQKRAYGKRLTALLQRKGKLPMEAKPTVGVSSFPKQAIDSLFPIVGGVMGYSKENPVAGPVVGALAGYGAEKAWNSDAVRGAIAKGMDAVPGLRNFAADHPLLTGAGAGLAGIGLGLGVHAGVKKLNDRFKSPSPVAKQASVDNAELLAKLRDYLSQAGHGAMSATDFVKQHAGGTAAIGAGIGGLAGALSGKSKNKETGEGDTRGRNALIGALLGGGAGLAAHQYGVQPAEQAILKVRTSDITPQPEYKLETGQDNPLNVLKPLGLAPLNVGQNAPPSALSIKPRF